MEGLLGSLVVSLLWIGFSLAGQEGAWDMLRFEPISSLTSWRSLSPGASQLGGPE